MGQRLGTRTTLINRVALTGVAVLLAGAALDAQRGIGRGGERIGPGPDGLARGLQELSLSDAQRDEIRTILENSRDTSQPLREQLRAIRQSLHAAVTDDVVNESEIRALAAQMAPLEAEAAVQRAHTHSAVMMVLTPDQRDDLDALRDEARERFRTRREQRRERRLQRR